MRGVREPARTPDIWAARIIGSLVLVAVGVTGLVLAVYEFNRWQIARAARGIPQDYSPGTYVAVMLTSGLLGLGALGALYVVGMRWRMARRADAPGRERI